MRQMLLHLFAKISTIRFLIIVVDDWEGALIVLELLAKFRSTGVPMLQQGGDVDRRSADVIPEAFFSGGVAPCLQCLTLSGKWSGSVLENLTTFDIRRLPAPYLLRVAQKLPSFGEAFIGWSWYQIRRPRPRVHRPH